MITPANFFKPLLYEPVSELSIWKSCQKLLERRMRKESQWEGRGKRNHTTHLFPPHLAASPLARAFSFGSLCSRLLETLLAGYKSISLYLKWDSVYVRRGIARRNNSSCSWSSPKAPSSTPFPFSEFSVSCFSWLPNITAPTSAPRIPPST